MRPPFAAAKPVAWQRSIFSRGIGTCAVAMHGTSLLEPATGGVCQSSASQPDAHTAVPVVVATAIRMKHGWYESTVTYPAAVTVCSVPWQWSCTATAPPRASRNRTHAGSESSAL